MSYILDALKKADRDRSLGEVPDLETSHWRARKHTSLQKWILFIGALLVFNGLLLFVLLERNETGEIVATDQPQPGIKQPENRPARSGQRDPAMTQKPVTTRPRVNRPAPVVLPPATQAQVVPVPRPTKVAPQPTQAAPQPTRTAPQASQQASAPSGEFDIPEWRELSLEFRSGLTLPHIDVHVYAEDPGRRFIMADLKKYREGETLANGSVLEKIHPGSIQLNYKGKRFRVDR